MPSIKIENITTEDYQRLQSEAAEVGLSLRNYARRRLGIAPAKRGRPEPKGKPVKQPKGKKRGVKRNPEEIETAKKERPE